MLDIELLRADHGGDPERVRESQRRRYADVSLVDKVIALDEQWRQCRGALDIARRELNKTQERMKPFYKEKKPVPDELTREKSACDAKIEELNAKETALIDERDKSLVLIGNIVDDTVHVSDDEDHNPVVRTNGEFSHEPWMLSHVDLTHMAGMANTEKGSQVAGSRGYFLTGPGVLLNQALIQYGIHFLKERGYTAMQTPYFMKQSIMGKVAQLAQFDEELYKVTGEGDDKYLVATSEQPICAFHLGEWVDPKELPMRFAGMSSCFRKEAGSHGRDQLGIFRVHQFEKIEQFVVTSPEGRASWDEHEKMIANSEAFYKSLGIPYRVVNIVSGALNDAAAKKYDLEAWFPGSKAHRELVSCSNCTDYQARRLGCRYGIGKKTADAKKEYCHMLNSTLTATERTICCIVENYQEPTGIRVPDVLVPFMNGMTFIPYKLPFPGKVKKGEQIRHHVPTEEELRERMQGPLAVGEYLAKHGVAEALTRAINEVASKRPDKPLEAIAHALLSGGAGASSAAQSGGELSEDALMKMSVVERAEYERKRVKKGGGGLEFHPDEVAEDGGDATLDDFFGALGVEGGDGPIADSDEEADTSKAGGELSEDALMKMSVVERAEYERKRVKKGGGGLEFHPDEVAEDGGDATLDDFFGALGVEGGDGPIADSDEEADTSKAGGELSEDALMKMSVVERAEYERKRVKKGGGGLEFHPDEVAEDGGDATLDDFLGALGV